MSQEVVDPVLWPGLPQCESTYVKVSGMQGGRERQFWSSEEERGARAVCGFGEQRSGQGQEAQPVQGEDGQSVC